MCCIRRLEKYKNIFGKPKQGVHSYRLFNIAIVDVVGTLILAIIFSKLYNIKILHSFIILLIFSIFIHKIFCVETTLTQII